MSSVLLSVVAFLFAIGLLVAVHEWGHYIVARLMGVKVLRYSIGFGKVLWSRKSGEDQTEYCFSAIPLGGYVKLLDEREGDVDPAEAHRAFNSKSISARIAILVAGPLLNFVFAVVAFWAMFVAGVPGLKPIIGEIEPGGIAAVAGVQPRDRIVAIGDESVSTWEGGVLALLDGLLTSDELRVELTDENNVSRQVILDVSGKVSELTEPGALFTGLGMRPWSPSLPAVMGEISPDGSAHASGFVPGDRVVSADGIEIADWVAWVEFVRDRPQQQVSVTIERAGVQSLQNLSIGEATMDDGSVIGRIGVGPDVPEDFYAQYSAEQKYGPIAAVGVAMERTWSMSALTVRMVARMVTGDVSAKNISGPINIAQYAGQSAAIGLASFLNFLAVVSLSLGIINLFPIPVLDGGQIVYQLAEAVKGSPLSERSQLIGQQFGMFLLMLLMGFAFYNDLTRVFS
jgi:regulator of sigma E protease